MHIIQVLAGQERMLEAERPHSFMHRLLSVVQVVELKWISSSSSQEKPSANQDKFSGSSYAAMPKRKTTEHSIDSSNN